MPVAIRLENSDKTALIDESDYETVSKYTWWYVNESKYAVTRIKTPGKVTIIKLNRFILELTDKKLHVNHKNDNNLDCQRENLEVVKAGKVGRIKAAKYPFCNNPLPARTNIAKNCF